ncbi:class I SAM-dependent methyltransferase [Hyphobacterium sp. HN65]|uniref:Class I SAM-dependent methyltransferase n=1 Tax=Hyphobacterium lacteum TaxID=3116575 RepID=A0ABU7LSP8_9PROT|nr:class I SAM-dependent methyltransferase [Hyphobacterium sp. HN65]MEE2526926.1 class I SAM-dependent methyltransferase [Hyphobacterium sp. HN65]
MSRSIGLDATLTDYVRRANPAESAALKRCREETDGRQDAMMQISPEQGAFMKMMARMVDAKIAVEVGVFTGYSAMAVAETMKERHGSKARLYACDVSDELVGIAEGYWNEGGVADIIQPVIGDARESLIGLINDGLVESVDMMFVDADKTSYPDYYTAGMTLLRPGGVMLFDNVLWNGSVADPAKSDPDTDALRAIAEKVNNDPRVDNAFTAIGDGLLIAMKR